jgi:hypothetical protein
MRYRLWQLRRCLCPRANWPPGGQSWMGFSARTGPSPHMPNQSDEIMPIQRVAGHHQVNVIRRVPDRRPPPDHHPPERGRSGA